MPWLCLKSAGQGVLGHGGLEGDGQRAARAKRTVPLPPAGSSYSAAGTTRDAGLAGTAVGHGHALARLVLLKLCKTLRQPLSPGCSAPRPFALPTHQVISQLSLPKGILKPGTVTHSSAAPASAKPAAPSSTSNPLPRKPGATKPAPTAAQPSRNGSAGAASSELYDLPVQAAGPPYAILAQRDTNSSMRGQLPGRPQSPQAGLGCVGLQEDRAGHRLGSPPRAGPTAAAGNAGKPVTGSFQALQVTPGTARPPLPAATLDLGPVLVPTPTHDFHAVRLLTTRQPMPFHRRCAPHRRPPRRWRPRAGRAPGHVTGS
jgi:hypothetical protein